MAIIFAIAEIGLCFRCHNIYRQGRLLTLHAVACILAWNASRGRRGGSKGGCLDQEGMREDLVGMFRRALEGGLQTVSKTKDGLRGTTASVTFLLAFFVPGVGCHVLIE